MFRETNKIYIFDKSPLLLDCLDKSISCFGLRAEKISEFREEYLNSDGIIYNCGCQYDTVGVLEGFYGILPFFERGYQGNIILISYGNRLSQEDTLEKLFDSRISFFTLPFQLPLIISQLLTKPTESSESQRHFCCNSLMRCFPSRKMHDALEGLKNWYSETNIDKLMQLVGQPRSFAQLEHDISNQAPWINKLKACFIKPLPLFLDKIPENLGILIVDDESRWFDDIRKVIGVASNDLWKVEWARDRKEALEKLKAYFEATGNFFPIDVILLDLQFSEKTDEGIKILEEIRKLSQNIPVIVLTVQFGTSVKIIDCLEKGANYYSTKMELNNLPAYIARVMQTSRPNIDERSFETDLSNDEKYMLKHLLRENTAIVVEKNMSSEMSKAGNKKIFQLRRYVSLDGESTEQVPVIVKIGPAKGLANEYENFRRYIAPYLPLHAAKIDRFLIYKEKAILSYIKVSGANDDLELNHVTSLYDGLVHLGNEGKIEEIIASLNRFITKDIGPSWYEKAVLPDPMNGRVFDHYARKMPIVLSLTSAEAINNVKTLSCVSDLTHVKNDQHVELMGHLVKNKGKIFILSFASQFKICIDEKLAKSYSSQNGNFVTITGKVNDTLCDMLQREWQEAVDHYMGNGNKTHIEQSALESIEKSLNPIPYIWDILFKPLDGKISIIHGDFHMNNMFFDFERKIGWLIDYGSSTRGHVCFDFIRLEVDIRTRLLARYFQEYKGTLNDMLMFERSLPPFNGPLFIRDERLWRQLTNMRKFIGALRLLGRRYFYRPASWREYFQGLFCYALNTFKFQQEKNGENGYPYSRFLPMACAVTAYHSCLKQPASRSFIKAVIFDLWNTLFVGSGNPLSHYLKDKVSSSDFIKVRDILLTRDLKIDDFISLIKQCDSSFTREKLNKIMAKVTLEFKPGAAKLIRDLYRCGLKLGIISNDWALEHAAVVEKLKNENLWGCFSCTIFSFQEGIMKPDTGLFKKALEQLNVKPSEAYMVGDSHTNDIMPGKHLGINTFQVTSDQDLDAFWNALHRKLGVWDVPSMSK